MTPTPVHVDTLPPFTNTRALCAQCGARREIMIMYCRGCTSVVGGEHFHRRCECGHRWAEQTSEAPATTATELRQPLRKKPLNPA